MTEKKKLDELIKEKEKDVAENGWAIIDTFYFALTEMFGLMEDAKKEKES